MDGKPVVYLHPIGKLDKDEVDAIVSKAKKALGLAVEIGPELTLLGTMTDTARGQIVATRLLPVVPAVIEVPKAPPPMTTYGSAHATDAILGRIPPPPPAPAPGTAVPGTAAGTPAGASTPGAPGAPAAPVTPSAPAAPLLPFARIGVVDNDMCATGHEFLFMLAEPKMRRGVVALRRLREAFYRRKSDPARQKGRAAREFIAAVGAARGLPPCQDPRCLMWESRTVMEIDRKDERFCASCNNHIRGRMRW